MPKLKILPKNETIRLHLKISLRYLLVKSGFYFLLFGVLVFFAPQQQILLQLLSLILFLILSYTWIFYFITDYFFTENRVYHQISFFWTKIIEVEKDDINDISSVQSVLDRFIFGSGTIFINTSEGKKIEVILRKIDNPYEVKRKISEIWEA